MARSRVAATRSKLGIGATICIAVAVLHFAQEVLIPLALAVLLSFLLAPLSTRLERRRLNRVSAVLVIVTLAFGAIFALGWIVGNQVVQLDDQLPFYEKKIVQKAQRLRQSVPGLGGNIAHLRREIARAAAEPATQIAVTQPATAPGAAKSAIDQVAADPTRTPVFVAILPPGGVLQAKYLCRRLRRQFKDLKIVVGFWGRAKNFDRLLVTFRRAGASYVTTSLRQSQSELRALLPPAHCGVSQPAVEKPVATPTGPNPAGA